MDDTLESVDSDDAAVSPSRDLTEVMKRGGFHLTKWASKSSEVLREIAEIKEIEHQRSPAVRTLGVVYYPSKDTFKITSPTKEFVRTPRGILSFVSSVWDPLAFVSPFVVRGRVFLQEL